MDLTESRAVRLLTAVALGTVLVVPLAVGGVAPEPIPFAAGAACCGYLWLASLALSTDEQSGADGWRRTLAFSFAASLGGAALGNLLPETVVLWLLWAVAGFVAALACGLATTALPDRDRV